MDKNALNILSDAISEVGSWHSWLVKDEMVQIQFCDILLYDETKPEKEPHTTDVLAVRFYGNSFAVFLDNLDDDSWYLQLRDDDSVLYPVDTYELAFGDTKEAESLLNNYTHTTRIKDFFGLEMLTTTKHLIRSREGSKNYYHQADVI